MKREESKFPFISLNPNSPTPLHRQIYERVRQAILSGEISAKSPIASTRVLARDLGISRMTIVNAYEQLFAEGYLESKIGSGTFVASKLPEELLQTSKAKTKTINSPANFPLRLSHFGKRMAKADAKTASVEIVSKFQTFQNGITAVDKFPFDVWSRIVARLHQNPSLKLLGYGEPTGYRPLREAIAEHLKSARAVNCEPEQVIVVSGAQHTLDLTTRIFIEENDAVWVEDPCYSGTKNAFLAARAKIIPVPVDAEGLNFSQMKNGGEKPKLIYVTPSHQFPLGVTMSLSRRLALLEWARQNDAWIIEDDYNSEFRYAGRPLESLQGLDRQSRVIYIGTFSKTIFPSLRLGCMVVPKNLVDIFTAARAISDIHSPLIDQAILSEFISEGHFARHIRRMHSLYHERQQILVEESKKRLAGMLDVSSAETGMHLIGWLPDEINDKLISEKAAHQDVKVKPVSTYIIKNRIRGGLILGYTAFNEKQIKNKIRQLTIAFES